MKNNYNYVEKCYRFYNKKGKVKVKKFKIRKTDDTYWNPSLTVDWLRNLEKQIYTSHVAQAITKLREKYDGKE